MNPLLKLVLFPILFAFDVPVVLPEEERNRDDDLVVFEVTPPVTPSPVTPSSVSPRVRTAYETAHLALRGVAASSSELEVKRVQASRSSSPVKQISVPHVPKSEVEVLKGQLNMWRELQLKTQKSKPKTA